MLESIRTHSKWLLGFVLLLIIPSFIFFGVDGYSRMNEGGNATVAKVAGNDVTQSEWDFAHARSVENLRQRMPGVDSRLFDSPQFKRESLDALVRERVLLAAANDAHLFPSDARLQRLFTTDPQYAQLRNADGSVRRELLAAQGMTSEMFAQQLRTQFGMQQVLGGVARSVVAPATLTTAALDALLQQRDIQVQRFDTAAYRAQVSPTETELQAWHQAHAEDFRAPETAEIEYVMLDLAVLSRDVVVPEADLQRYYEENASRYTVAEERRASHILVQADQDMPAADREKAREKAETLLRRVQARPGDFAKLARENSDDPGSAEQGGDLDYFGRGAMVRAFEDAVFSMKPGDVSPVIETDFGFHIIQLTAVRGGERQPLSELRGEIEAEVRRSLAQRRYAEAAEQFSNMVYEQSDTLEPVIDRFKLDKRQATVQRTPAPDAAGPLASAAFLEAVFGQDALRNQRNTEAVEVGNSQLVSARVVSHQPERTLPLAEVMDQVRERVIAEQAAALARQEGEKRLAEVRASADLALPDSATVSRMQAGDLPRAVIDAALRADPDQLPSTQGVDLGAEGFAVLRVSRVVPRETPSAADAESLRAQVAQALSDAEALAYYEALKQRYKVSVSAPAAAASGP